MKKEDSPGRNGLRQQDWLRMKDLLLNGIIDGIISGNKSVYNPVFLYGEESAVDAALSEIAARYRAKNPSGRVTRVSGDEFTDAMIDAAVTGTRENFRKTYRESDLLIFDHVETIAGREITMIEFYELFDHVFMQGGNIVAAGSCTPGMMEGLADRIRTQLEGGIIQKVR